MASKRTSKAGESGDLLAAAEPFPQPPASPPAIPQIFEYRPLMSTEQWRIEKFEMFIAEFEMAPPFERAVIHFHAEISQFARQWLIARRLFGISPVLLPDDAKLEDYEPLSRESICGMMGLKPKDLQAELDAMRAMLKGSAEMEEEESAAPAAVREEIRYDDDILREHGFPDSLFVLKYCDGKGDVERARPAAENRLEKAWFAKQVRDWAKMLSEPLAGTLARKALMNMLYLHRMEDAMASVAPDSSKFSSLQKSKDQLEERYMQQISDLQEMFPDFAVAGRVSFRAVISELITGWRNYKTKRDRQLIDRVRTAAEVEVDLRQSLQKPEVPYRFGQTLYIIEATHHFWDPDYRSQLRLPMLKKLDTAFRESIERMRQAGGEPLVDLEKGVFPGEGDDFPDLVEVEEKAL